MHEKLRQFFEQKGISQLQLAEMLDVSPQYVNVIINGKKPIGKKTAEKLSNLFGLSKLFLLTGEGKVVCEDRKQSIINRAHDIQRSVLGHVVEEHEGNAGIASEDIRPFIPTWADTLLSILSKQIAENEVLHAELRQSISDVQEMKEQLSIIIEKIK